MINIVVITRLSSVLLRPTTRECVHLVTTHAWSLPVTWQKRQSHHAMRHSSKPHATCSKLHGLCFIEPELLPIDVLHCGNGNFRPFCSCDLDLDPMTFIYECDPYSLEIYRVCKYELPMSRLSKVILWQTVAQTDRQTRPKLYTTSLRG